MMGCLVLLHRRCGRRRHLLYPRLSALDAGLDPYPIRMRFDHSRRRPRSYRPMTSENPVAPSISTPMLGQGTWMMGPPAAQACRLATLCL